MPTAIHSFSQEEMMAYLDGELSADRGLAAAQHLEQCRDCQRLAADFQSVSQKLLDWHVDPITSAPPQVEVIKRPQAFFRRKPWVLATCSVAMLVVVIAALTPSAREYDAAPMNHPAQVTAMVPPQDQRIMSAPNEARGTFVLGGNGMIGGVAGSVPGPLPPPPAPAIAPPGGTRPLIVRTARLAVTSKSFDASRAELERIVKTHQGYISQLQSNNLNGAARVLTATLRAPAATLDPMLQDLRRLGRVNQESQTGDDVTQRYVDTDARLSNLRTTEERLLQILRDRTGRLADVLQVEEAVDRTRGEIEVAEADKRLLSNQIALASVDFTLSEEYKASIETGETSAFMRLRNSAVEGYRNVVGIAMTVLELLLSIGPALFILSIVAFFPGRWLWRRRQRRLLPFES